MSLFKTEKSKEGASTNDKLSLGGRIAALEEFKVFIDTLDVEDPYEQYIQYDSIKAGIQAHAEIYSFNIESELFNQLTKEQQALWRKEIEQACISGGGAGYELAKDPRYKKNLEVKEADLEKELNDFLDNIVGVPDIFWHYDKQIEWAEDIAKHFFELGLKAKQE